MQIIFGTLISSVETGGAAACYSSSHIDVTVDTEGYIASIVTSQSGHGSADCPWKLTTKSGQRLNITLIDYTDYSNLGAYNILHTVYWKQVFLSFRYTI